MFSIVSLVSMDREVERQRAVSLWFYINYHLLLVRFLKFDFNFCCLILVFIYINS